MRKSDLSYFTKNDLKDQRYNGWSNRSTWAVNLHLSNDQDLAERITELVVIALHVPEEEDAAIHLAYEIENKVKEWMEETMERSGWDTGRDSLKSLGIDLLRASLSQVQWIEIAESWLDCGITG